MRKLPALALFAALAGCGNLPVPDMSALLPGGPRPAMAWDHRPEAATWTVSTMSAVARHDSSLAATVPADIETFCPGYPKASTAARRAFWSGLLSATARYESSWNPAASGGGGRYIGLMQISPRSAANYGCSATSTKALKDGSANLECAVTMMAHHVGRDGLVAGKGNRGIGRDWMPFRKAGTRAEIAEWTRSQSYCRR